MKATKLIAVMAFAAFGFCTDRALAQGNDQTQQAAPPVTSEENAAVTGEETEPHNETVTIDSGTGAGSSNAETGIAEQPEKKEKLRVYSGKQDGNNVIYDPR
jgi:hypothetical protein